MGRWLMVGGAIVAGVGFMLMSQVGKFLSLMSASPAKTYRGSRLTASRDQA
jgi:hypothetical protein